MTRVEALKVLKLLHQLLLADVVALEELVKVESLGRQGGWLSGCGEAGQLC